MSLCSKCNKIGNIILCDNCKCKVCQQCSELSASEVRCIELKKRKLIYLCQTCETGFKQVPVLTRRIEELEKQIWEIEGTKTDSSEEVKKMVAEVLKVVEKHNDKICSMEKAVQIMQKGLNSCSSKQEIEKEKNTSYAKAVKEPALIVKPVIEQNASETIKELKNKVNPTDLAVGIQELRGIRKGGVVISCSDKKSLEKMKDKVMAEMGDKYSVNTSELKNPRLIVIGVEVDYIKQEDSEILKAIGEQNDIINDVKKIKIVNKYEKKEKRNSGNVILEAEPEIIKKLLEREKIHIGYRSCKVYEHYSIIRCFRCGAFGHKKGECRNEQICFRCGENNHMTKECESEVEVCANCINTNKRVNLRINVNHSINDFNCPCYVRVRDSVIKKTKSYE